MAQPMPGFKTQQDPSQALTKKNNHHVTAASVSYMAKTLAVGQVSDKTVTGDFAEGQLFSQAIPAALLYMGHM